jgi:hypothetical protein
MPHCYYVYSMTWFTQPNLLLIKCVDKQKLASTKISMFHNREMADGQMRLTNE